MKHDEIIEDLIYRLQKSRPNGKSFDHLNFCNNGIYGETDLAFIDDKLMYLVEVKTNDSVSSRKKAIQQLKKDYDYFISCHDIDRIFAFYAYKSNKNKRKYYVELINLFS